MPSGGSVHFWADEAGALRLQLPAQAEIVFSLTTCKNKRSGQPRDNRRGKRFIAQQVAMIDSVESAQQALDELIAREGPSASLMHLFNATVDEYVQMSNLEGQEEEGSSGSPVSVAEVCMAGTPPPQPLPLTEDAA